MNELLITPKFGEVGFHLLQLDGTFKHYPTQPWYGNSHVLVCPKCGKVWGKIISGQTELDWQPLSVVCEDCPGRITRTAGSLYNDFRDSFYPHLPFELLVREFHLEVNFLRNY